MTPPENELDQEALAALDEVTLKLFTADPSSIAPFESSTISWEVSVPRESDVPVDIDLNGMPVSTSGQLLVAPESTASYQLRARARRYSRVLATRTVEVDLAVCIAHSDNPLFVLTSVIKGQITSDTSGIYFQSIPEPVVVAIQDDKMTISLRLQQSVAWFPDPTVNIDASFELGVVAIPFTGRRAAIETALAQYRYHELAPVAVNINTDVSFPWYAWLVPGAILGLPIAISGAEEKAYKKASDMVDQVVSALNGWFHQSDVQPPRMDKHDASFYVNPSGDQRFWINFCPAPSQGVLEA